MDVDGVLLDIDGVLTVSWEPIPGSIEALDLLRDRGLPFRLITNTTTHTRDALASTLREAGFDVEPNMIVTAVVATASYVRAYHPGARVLVLSDGDPREDLEGVEVVDPGEEADVVVIGGASEGFTYEAMNQIFRLLMDGAALVGMHRNMYWRTSDGLELDGGAYIAGLEEAAGVSATICGKPAAAFFGSALDMLGTSPSRTAMVGDDIVNDVLGAQAAGLSGVLVKTGKFLPADLAKGKPDVVLDSLADLPDLLGIR
ncbi:MAG: TIGR01458 family HAD-type hydrolase [Actinomycetota bacterium]|nr:TIGR01458 family HAD-type hydrolase [Actinomycetota bacterium]